MKKFVFLILLFVVVGAASAQTLPTIAILGDSYSTFENYVEPSSNEVWYFSSGRDYTDVKDVRETWWQVLAREHGYKIGINNSYSGSTVCRTGYRGEDYTDRAFITRMSNLGTPAIILIFGATTAAWA
ncbi:MAG: SGNH/GDSL hydrolase family protein, partial [Duncaniella sp.]|nr:SGNH/GDSL hydrolase family protein [Duncaniella sp.]